MDDKITLGSKVLVNTTIDENGVRSFESIGIDTYETEVITNQRLFNNQMCVLVKGIGQYIPIVYLIPNNKNNE